MVPMLYACSQPCWAEQRVGSSLLCPGVSRPPAGTSQARLLPIYVCLPTDRQPEMCHRSPDSLAPRVTQDCSISTPQGLATSFQKSEGWTKVRACLCFRQIGVRLRGNGDLQAQPVSLTVCPAPCRLSAPTNTQQSPASVWNGNLQTRSYWRSADGWALIKLW